MASGNIHALATLSAANSFLVVAVADGFPVEYAVGAFAGLLLSPDLDVDDGNLSYYLVGPFRRIWGAYWWFYAKLMGHRSFWSHFPVVGTLIRFLYVFWPAFLFMGWPVTLPMVQFLVGLAAADTIHWLMDFRLFSRIWR